jgi:hypothetical protein
MRTPKKETPDFSQLGNTLMHESQAPAPDGKPYSLTFHIEPDLVEAFERELYHHSRTATKKTIGNAALRYYLENHPEARERSQRPIPGK